MLEKVGGTSSTPGNSSGATKRKSEDSTSGQQDAKIRKIDQTASSSKATPTATSSDANTQTNIVNRPSTSATVSTANDTTDAVPPETINDSTSSDDEPGKWSCGSCTFQNHPALDTCEVCSTPRNALEKLKVQLEELKRKTSLVQAPSHWLTVDPGIRMKRVKVAENDKDYLEIHKKLLKCCSASACNTKFRIKKIERVENLHLYQMFSVKKSQMDEGNGSVIKNERMLWHGTAPDCIDNIASYGFNRSHCGKNGSKFGKGVYFSTTPCYSADARYAKPDSYGLQYMFYCRVLTGRFTVGAENMVEPPTLQNNVGRFDSLANSVQFPEMFVIFHDAQAYPAFLVTFTCK